MLKGSVFFNVSKGYLIAKIIRGLKLSTYFVRSFLEKSTTVIIVVSTVIPVNLVVSDLQSETKGSWFEFGC